ncbi:MAG: hypothetical protein Q9M50_02060 [Methylococcales bacterium]|nr:hypothetical protein [Methylococcales bacterium]
MKKITVAAILSSALLISGHVSAESTSLTNQNIQGSWALEYTKKSEDAEKTVKREDTWIFKNDGKVTITHIAREGGYYDQSPVNYEIEAGKLKISILGRAGKFDKFTLVKKEDKIMILKARFGDIYQFIKK